MPIVFIKSARNSEAPDASYNIDTLREYLQTRQSAVVGLDVTYTPPQHFVYLVTEEGELHRYPIRKIAGEHSCFRMFHKFDATKNIFSTTPKYAVSSVKITIDQSNIFSASEQDQLIVPQSQTNVTAADAQEAPFDSDSPLTQEQQARLFHLSTEDRTFCGYLQYILDFGPDSSQRILAAAISRNHPNLTEEETYERRLFRLMFLALNKIQRFPNALLQDATGKVPTVGAVFDYFVFCIQQRLETKVEDSALIRYRSSNRERLVGGNDDFGDDGIYNPQGLIGDHDKLFRCIYLILGAQPEANTVARMKDIIQNNAFYSFRFTLLNVLSDILLSATTDKATQLTQYIEVYDCIQIMYPKKGWHHFSAHIKNAQKAIFELSFPSAETIKIQFLQLGFLRLDDKIWINTYIDSHREFYQQLHASDDPIGLIYLLCTLHHVNLLAGVDFTALASHKHPYGLANALNTLHQAHLLSPENYATAIKHGRPNSLASALHALQQLNLLSPERFAVVVNPREPLEFSRILDTDFWTDFMQRHYEYIPILIDVYHPNDLSTVMSALHQEGLLNQENFKAMVTHRFPMILTVILILFRQNGLLTPENQAALVNQEFPHPLALALNILHQVNLLTPENRRAVVASSMLITLAKALDILRQADLLNQENFDVIKQASSQTITVLDRFHQFNALDQFTFSQVLLLQRQSNDSLTSFISKYSKTIQAYRKILSSADAAHGDIQIELRPAYALLYDYTKGKVGLVNSSLSFFGSIAAKCKRGLTGHMNRHHIDAVAEILKDIRLNQINTNTLAQRLQQIKEASGFNPLGSLAKRISLIYKECRIQEPRREQTQAQEPTANRP